MPSLWSGQFGTVPLHNVPCSWANNFGTVPQFTLSLDRAFWNRSTIYHVVGQVSSKLFHSISYPVVGQIISEPFHNLPCRWADNFRTVLQFTLSLGRAFRNRSTIYPVVGQIILELFHNLPCRWTDSFGTILQFTLSLDRSAVYCSTVCSVVVFCSTVYPGVGQVSWILFHSSFCCIF